MLSSLPPMRRFSYPIFFLLHYVGLIGFLVSINRHTVYAGPWATYIVMAIYASDILGRIASMRVRWVEAEALDGGMVKISMPGVVAGWRGGQHLSVRLFFVPPPLPTSKATGRLRRFASQFAHGLRGAVRPFEAHPLSIATAPPADAVTLSSAKTPRGIELYARSCGPNTWTGDLHRYVVEGAQPLPARARSTTGPAPSPRITNRKVYIPCLFEGPYGGIPAHESPAIQNDTETVLLVAGGSGMSFVLGELDSIVGRRLASGRAGRVEVVWVVRQRAHLAWFADRLSEMVAAVDGSPLRVVVRAFVTCDETLTTAIPTSSPPPESAASTNAESSTPPLELLLSHFAEKATISYIRPSLRDVVRDTVDRALAPCGHCFPVCRCGEVANASAAGMCANDEEECVGGCGGVANARELVVDEELEAEKKQKDRGGDDEKDEIDSLPALAQKAGAKSCCSKKASTLDVDTSTLDVDTISEITELPTVVNVGPSSCCGPTAVGSSSTSKSGCGGCCSRTAGGGCCSGAIVGPASPAGGDRDEQDRQEGKPLRVRTDGMAVIVCGPGNMVVSLFFNTRVYSMSLWEPDSAPLNLIRPKRETPSPGFRSPSRFGSAESRVT